MVRRKRKSRRDRTYRENIEVFLSCVEELRERPFILDGLHEFQFHINVDKELGQLTYESQDADQEHFRSFLLTFRQFILNDEPSNIDWVLKVCSRFVKDKEEELREVLHELKSIWKYRYRKGVVQMHTDGLALTPKYVLDLWINGQHFHRADPERMLQLKELLAKELPFVKIQLLWSLPLLTDVILRVGAVVSKALKAEAFDFPKNVSE